MTVETFIQWALRIALALLAFVVVKWALPLLLGMAHISIPEDVTNLLAVVVGLLVLAGGWYWRRTAAPPAA